MSVYLLLNFDQEKMESELLTDDYLTSIHLLSKNVVVFISKNVAVAMVNRKHIYIVIKKKR